MPDMLLKDQVFPPTAEILFDFEGRNLLASGILGLETETPKSEELSKDLSVEGFQIWVAEMIPLITRSIRTLLGQPNKEVEYSIESSMNSDEKKVDSVLKLLIRIKGVQKMSMPTVLGRVEEVIKDQFKKAAGFDNLPFDIDIREIQRSS